MMREDFIRIVALVTCAMSGAAHPDSIAIGGERYDDVLISESSVFYYVSIPEDGTVLNVPKTDVDPASVSRTTSAQQRAMLRARWNAARDRRIGESNVIELHAVSPASGLDAIAAALEDSKRPPPRQLAHHTDAGQGPPVFYLKGSRKVDSARRAEIRANVARMRQTQSSAAAAGQGLGAAPAQAGGGSDRGSGGRGGGGGEARSTFGNISELFGTIDDRSVGETPSPFN